MFETVPQPESREEALNKEEAANLIPLTAYELEDAFVVEEKKEELEVPPPPYDLGSAPEDIRKLRHRIPLIKHLVGSDEEAKTRRRATRRWEDEVEHETDDRDKARTHNSALKNLVGRFRDQSLGPAFEALGEIEEGLSVRRRFLGKRPPGKKGGAKEFREEAGKVKRGLREKKVSSRDVIVGAGAARCRTMEGTTLGYTLGLEMAEEDITRGVRDEARRTMRGNRDWASVLRLRQPDLNLDTEQDMRNILEEEAPVNVDTTIGEIRSEYSTEVLQRVDRNPQVQESDGRQEGVVVVLNEEDEQWEKLIQGNVAHLNMRMDDARRANNEARRRFKGDVRGFIERMRTRVRSGENPENVLLDLADSRDSKDRLFARKILSRVIPGKARRRLAEGYLETLEVALEPPAGGDLTGEREKNLDPALSTGQLLDNGTRAVAVGLTMSGGNSRFMRGLGFAVSNSGEDGGLVSSLRRFAPETSRSIEDSVRKVLFGSTNSNNETGKMRLPRGLSAPVAGATVVLANEGDPTRIKTAKAIVLGDEESASRLAGIYDRVLTTSGLNPEQRVAVLTWAAEDAVEMSRQGEGVTPNYRNEVVKTVGREIASDIRLAVNSDPRLSKVGQIAGELGAAAARLDPEIAEVLLGELTRSYEGEGIALLDNEAAVKTIVAAQRTIQGSGSSLQNRREASWLFGPPIVRAVREMEGGRLAQEVFEAAAQGGNASRFGRMRQMMEALPCQGYIDLGDRPLIIPVNSTIPAIKGGVVYLGDSRAIEEPPVNLPFHPDLLTLGLPGYNEVTLCLNQEAVAAHLYPQILGSLTGSIQMSGRATADHLIYGRNLEDTMSELTSPDVDNTEFVTGQALKTEANMVGKSIGEGLGKHAKFTRAAQVFVGNVMLPDARRLGLPVHFHGRQQNLIDIVPEGEMAIVLNPSPPPGMSPSDYRRIVDFYTKRRGARIACLPRETERIRGWIATRLDMEGI